ncbi:MAG: hypothetical protein ACFFCS_18560, partial [Candidatus Hodarchaeota archaeon]
EELERVMGDGTKKFVVVHLLGLDFCKDNGLDTSGAIHTFKRIITSVTGTDYNVILTSDHSEDDIVPYIEIITNLGKE